MKNPTPGSTRRRQAGLSLIELMISLTLGMLVVLGATGIFVSNRRAYASTETLGRLQESARVAFELMSRDIREAGANPCGNKIPIANVLNDPTTRWWTDFQSGIRGYDNGALAGSAAGTDSVEVLSATSNGVSVVESSDDPNNSNNANIKVSTKKHGYKDGDIAMVCDYRQGSIFQISNANDNNNVIVHNTGNTVSPGNCRKEMGFPAPADCKIKGTEHNYGNNSMLVRFSASRWYVGDTPNGRALFRSAVRNSGGAAAPVAEEITEGVQDLQARYLERGEAEYTDPSGVADWREVVAVRLDLTFEARAGAERGANIQGTDAKALSRTVSHVVTLRNRVN